MGERAVQTVARFSVAAVVDAWQDVYAGIHRSEAARHALELEPIMRLSIVIPAYNEQDYLPSCLEQVLAEVRRCPCPDEVEVLVIDNASQDATAAIGKPRTGRAGGA